MKAHKGLSQTPAPVEKQFQFLSGTLKALLISEGKAK